MKTWLVLGCALLLLVGAGLGSAHAQPPGFPTAFPMGVSFDENCNGVWYNPATGVFNPLPCTLGVDPLSGIVAPVYTLPQPVVPGDVLVLETPGATQLSDFVRFTFDAAGIPNQMFYFSDIDEGSSPDMSDVGFPTNMQMNAVRVFENGTPEVYDYFFHPAGPAYYVGTSERRRAITPTLSRPR
jgi:hypothetical protein